MIYNLVVHEVFKIIFSSFQFRFAISYFIFVMLILLPEHSIVQSPVDWFVKVILKVYDESRLTFPLEIEFITTKLHDYKHQC